ncbi:glycosyltransferase [Caulobacter sp. S45]|uniref:glycosyltransferase n=1 Tax=Caulobacter sp. S45 TaxID=1641861 RepID=UPI00131A7475|nr:glycosyltransferase [Caulobacter sp. S45]
MRIFWLGMHKVLKPTELRSFRELQVEVFNPAYISPIYDQSADLTVDQGQPTTLPADIFAQLMAYDFFYKPITPEISSILNTYFDAVVVTISADWLATMLRAYQGPIIYRIYGQHFSLSEKIIDIGLWRTLMSRENFYIVPFCPESVENEHRWFLDLVYDFVPYQIPDDIFDCEKKWRFEDCRSEIATSIPNIQNPYFSHEYHKFSSCFSEQYFRIYGPQRAVPNDARLVGTLNRSDFLERIRRSAAFYYNFSDEVCYLPPIEMMQLGGPVVCVRGSLLARFLGPRSPNVANDVPEAKRKLRRLLGGDRQFAEELISAQEETRQRYDREAVQCRFREVFGKLIADIHQRKASVKLDGSIIRATEVCSDGSPTVMIPLHAGGLFGHRNGRAFAFEGIPRVVDSIVSTLSEGNAVRCLVSCAKSSTPAVYDFFIDRIKGGDVAIFELDYQDEQRDSPHAVKLRLDLVSTISKLSIVTSVFVPHYYLFPEFLLLTKRLTLYLPDYFPHLVPSEIFDKSRDVDARNKRVGVELAGKAEFILTNSSFTKNYIPDAGFVSVEDVSKVIVAPIPFLGEFRAGPLTWSEARMMFEKVGICPFLFYPTANRPNKRIDFLLDVFADLRKLYPSLRLVLTCHLDTHAPAREAAELHGFSNEIIFLPRSSEGVLKWLYENCVALCLTSIIEGNFPPQILEALMYGAPVVATNLPTVEEVLGPLSSKLLLCKAICKEDFIQGVKAAMNARDVVLARQGEVVDILTSKARKSVFRSQIANIFPEYSAHEGDL